MDLFGTKVNQRYTLQAELGRGGMATVYRAHDDLLGRTLAVKLLAPDFMKSATVLRRFMAEAQVMVRLHHTNVVTVLDFDHSPQPFIAMELVSGGSVRDLLLGTDPPDAAQALDIIDGVLSGLVRIHASGIIHRDIKPANILLTEAGLPKLTDFGIARDASRDRFLTRTNAVLGTPAFMAPEQRRSAAKVTEESDLYAVGATLYALLTRRSTADLYVREHQTEAFDAFEPSLKDFLTTACAFKARNRFSSAAEMQAALRAVRKNVLGDPRSSIPRPIVQRREDNLPDAPRGLYGRNDELAHIHAWAEATHTRMLSIVGLGGIGKSRLAVEFCRQQSALFPGGIWFVDVSACRTKDALYRELGTRLGLQFESTDPLAEIAGHLRAKADGLVVFDNAEEATLPLTVLIQHMLEWIPDLRIMVTSREPIGVPLETVLDISELDTPASVALLMDAARHTFELDEKTVLDSTSIEKIAQILGGHPLSLELAAAQLAMLGAAHLHDRLVRSLNRRDAGDSPTLMGLLDTAAGLETAPASSVEASLAWSWALLSEAEQSVLAQCSVFADGFDVDAAETVILLPTSEDVPPVMVLLQALRAKSLIRIRSPLPGCRRLSVPRLVGYFALTHADPTMLAGARDRMAQHYAPMGEEERILKSQTGDPDGYKRASLDLANVLSSFDRAMAQGEEETAAYLSLAAAQLLKHTGPFERLTKMLDDVDLLLDDDTPLKARVALNRASLAMTREPLAVTRRHLDRAIALGDSVNVASVRTAARINLAYVLSRTSRLDQGMALAEEAVQIALDSAETAYLPAALYCRGHLTNKAGKPHDALDDFEAALHGYQRLGDRIREGNCHGNIGEYHHNVGEPELAKQYYENALAIAQELGDRAGLVRGQRRIAWLHMDAARWSEAKEALRAGLEIARRLGDLPGEASLIGTLGAVAAHQDDNSGALGHFRAAKNIYRSQGNEEQFQRCEINIAVTMERLDRVDESIDIIERLKLTKGMLSRTRCFIQTLEMKLMIRKARWDEAQALGQRLLPTVKKKQYWEQAISVHSYLAICEAVSNSDPQPHLEEADSILKRLQLADGSDSGIVIANARAEIKQMEHNR